MCLCGQKKETHYSCWLMTKSSLFLWESQNKDLASQYISSFGPNVFMRHFMVQKVFAICAASNSTSFIYYLNSNFLPNFLCAKTKVFKFCDFGYIYIFSIVTLEFLLTISFTTILMHTCRVFQMYRNKKKSRNLLICLVLPVRIGPFILQPLF